MVILRSTLALIIQSRLVCVYIRVHVAFFTLLSSATAPSFTYVSSSACSSLQCRVHQALTSVCISTAQRTTVLSSLQTQVCFRELASLTTSVWVWRSLLLRHTCIHSIYGEHYRVSHGQTLLLCNCTSFTV